MTDIVEQLRDLLPTETGGYAAYDHHERAHKHAADEIERLRGVMETVADALHDKGDYECWAALRNALWQEGKQSNAN